MPDEPVVNVEVNPPSPAEPELEQAAEELETVEDLAEQIALQNIISEERQAEILEKVEQCQTRLEQLSMAESPSLTALQTEVSQLREEIANLKSLMDSKLLNPIPNPSPAMEPEPAPAEPEAAVLIEELAPAEAEISPDQAPKPKKNRFI